MTIERESASRSRFHNRYNENKHAATEEARLDIKNRIKELDQKIKKPNNSAVIARWRSQKKKLQRKLEELNSGVDIYRLDLAESILYQAILNIKGQYEAVEHDPNMKQYHMWDLGALEARLTGITRYIKIQNERTLASQTRQSQEFGS